jgi:RNA polymerase sigma-70 factor (ECF subfamily)
VTATTQPYTAVVAATGRDEAFKRFYAEEYPAVAGYALTLTGDRAIADEIAQEALVAVYVRWTRLGTPRGYAFRVAANLARSHWSRHCRELATWTALAEHASPTAEQDPAVWDAVRRLPDRLRAVVLLHYFYDLPLADVATAVRRPLGTVKRRLHEARAVLATALEEAP